MIQDVIEVLGETLELTTPEIVDILWLAQQKWQAPDGAIARLQRPSDSAEPTDEAPETKRPAATEDGATTGNKAATGDNQNSPLPPAGVQTRPPRPSVPTGDVNPPGPPIALPAAPLLRETLALMRALKPLRHNVPSTQRFRLNVRETVQYIAETNLWLPIREPEVEPWLELALVIDASTSMLIWQPLIRELQRLVRQSGVFRDVRLWSLDVVGGVGQLRPGYGPDTQRAAACSPKELIDPQGRRLIWVLSDCIDSRWQTATIATTLHLWAQQGPLALVQVLPEWLWRRTALQSVPKVQLHNPEWGQTTQALQINQRRRRPARHPVTKLPVVTLEPAVLTQWCQMLVAQGGNQTAGLLLPLTEAPADQPRPAPTPQARVETFKLFSSPIARRLARLLSGCPEINLPIIRLIQAAMVPQANQVHVAEVLFGGLLKPSQPLTPFADPETLQYVFHDPATQRQMLYETPPTDTFRTLSRWIQHRLGKTVDEFVAILQDPQQDLDLAFRTQPFAGIALEILLRQDRRYVDVAIAYLDRWLTDQLGYTVAEFTACFLDILRDPAQAAQIRPVAELLIYVLQAQKNHHLVNALRAWLRDGELGPAVVDVLAAPTANRWPAWQVLDFETGQFVVDGPPLEPQTVRVVTLRSPRERPPWPGQAATEFPALVSAGNTAIAIATIERDPAAGGWVIQRQRQTIARYAERLTPDLSLELVPVPAGTFRMGSPTDEPARYTYEGPQHTVTVPAFGMGQYPVTQAQWRFVAGLPPVERELDPDPPGGFKGNTRPVERVDWFAAVEFCARLSAHTGRDYRLPSEAEWEYACRAGTTTPFHFGATISPELANYDGTSTYNDGPQGEYRAETTPVDFFGVANAFGLCDMHGNVWEWCQDHFHDRYTGAPTDGSAWIDADAAEDETRVLRGGSWSSDPGSCRAAFRIHNDPRNSDNTFGFRVVVSLPRALA